MKLWKKISMHLVIVCIMICNLVPMKPVCAADTEGKQVADVKNGIVEIQSGIEDENGNFYKIKSCSGFLVSNTSDGVYIATNYNGITLSDNKKKKFAKKNKIKFDNEGDLETKIRLIVESDVESALEIKFKSEDENFAVLEAGNILRERTALALENQDEVVIGDEVYALGFAEQDAEVITYTSENVQIRAGRLEDNAAKIGRNKYLQHSAQLDKEINGGALVSAQGYVIGLNDIDITKEDDDWFYAVPISRIISFLDNYGIYYVNHQINESYERLEEVYNRCVSEYESDNYKEQSKLALEGALNNAEGYIAFNDNYSAEQFNRVAVDLKNAELELVKTTPKIRYLQIIVGIFIFGFFIWLLVILFTGDKNVKKNKNNFQRNKANMNVNGFGNNDPKSVPQGQMPYPPQGNGNVLMGGMQQNPMQQNPMPMPQNPINNGFMQPEYDDNRTVMLQSSSKSVNSFSGTLIREKTGMNYSICKAQTLIGKKQGAVDIVIPDNVAISRTHAKIVNDNGRYIIFDMNSANGTFVNGRAVDQSGAMLNSGDQILLADETFRFQV